MFFFKTRVPARESDQVNQKPGDAGLSPGSLWVLQGLIMSSQHLRVW